MVGLLFLDVKNAFNSAPWEVISRSLRNMGVPGYICRLLNDYFENRELLFDIQENGLPSPGS